jgi:phage terminase large subunit
MVGFQDTTATKKIFQLKKRIRAVSGGTSGSKTISILVWHIDYAQTHENEIMTVVGESVPHMNLGSIRDFQSIMIVQGYWDDSRWANNTYTFETGTIIEFISFDKFGKAHGPRRDVLFLNEANNQPYNIVDQLITRTRKIIWMDWNPTEDFWFYTEMLGRRDDIDFMGDGGNYPPLTYLDNEAIDEITKHEIETHKHDKNWWRVYGLGLKGELETRIYKGWRTDLDEVPHEARLESYGHDHGYSNDPAAGVAIYYYNGGYILDEVLYQRGLFNKNVADVYINLPTAPIYPDAAEPKANDEIASYGLTVIAAPKGADSVNFGIKFVQSQRISVTKRSVNLLKEYRNYVWITDKDGRITTDPIDLNNHLMDAIRYGMSPMIARYESNEQEIAERLRNRLNYQTNKAK